MRNILRLSVALMLSLFATGCAIHVYHHDGDSDCKSRCEKKCDKKGDCDKEDCDEPCGKGDCDKPCDKPCDMRDEAPCEKPASSPCHGGGGEDEAKEAFGRVTTEDLESWIAKKSVTVIDNNRPEIFAEGHIPGAKHVVWKDVTADKLPKDKAAKLVFYCANPQCMACHKAADAAIALGYTNVFIYPDGIQGWKDAGKKVEK